MAMVAMVVIMMTHLTDNFLEIILRLDRFPRRLLSLRIRRNLKIKKAYLYNATDMTPLSAAARPSGHPGWAELMEIVTVMEMMMMAVVMSLQSLLAC